jgi:PAS domain S-box-containing protein
MSKTATAKISRTQSRQPAGLEEILSQKAELEETLRAIRMGEVDAVVVEGSNGKQVFTLQGAEHPYRHFVETMEEGAGTLSVNGTVLYSNASFAAIFEAPLEKLIGSPLQQFMSEREVEVLQKLIEKGKKNGARGEIRLVTKEGRPRTVRLTLSPNREIGTEAVCVVATELTELLETNEALRMTEASLRRLSGQLLQLQDQERRRIARDLHDIIGQDVAMLSMSLDHLARVMQSPDAESRAILDECRQTSRRIGEQTRTLSYLLHPPLLDESGLASAVRWYAEGFEKRSSIRLVVDVAQDLGRFSQETETALFRVLQESLTNVHRYSGSPDAQIRISIDAGKIRLQVADQGRGVSAGAQRHPVEGLASLGVGIPGMRERLRQLGGQLEIDFGGNGTTVVATLPITTRLIEPAESKQTDSVTLLDQSRESVDVQTDPQTRSRILIADDHELMRRGLRTLIESHDEWVVCGEAIEGSEAVQKARELKPDLIIMDINMPTLTGLDAARQIRRENQSTKVIFFSVYDTAQMVLEVLNVGGQGYVPKSRAGSDLLDAVRIVLGGQTFFPPPSPE